MYTMFLPAYLNLEKMRDYCHRGKEPKKMKLTKGMSGDFEVRNYNTHASET